MHKVLRKRIGRDLKENLFRYLALAFMIILCMYLIVSMVGAAETIIVGSSKSAEQHRVEDGEFTVFVPLSDSEMQKLTSRGIDVEKAFYLDYTESETGTIRIYANRDKINQIVLDEGKLADNHNEIVLEKRYCEEHNLSVGDMVKISGNTYNITGIGTTPDYGAAYQTMSDSTVDSSQFGTAFATKDAYEQLMEEGKSSKSEEYVYSYRLNGKLTNEELKNILKEYTISADAAGNELSDEYMNITLTNMTAFITQEDNPRIGAAADDQVINKIGGLVAGVIVLVLFTYVISVFVIHGIEKESSVIGALYALGVKRKTLLMHYLTLPVLVTFLSAIVGSLLGLSRFGIQVQTQDCYGYFLLPDFSVSCPVYLYIYAFLLPPVIAAIVNYIVIRKHLSRTVLSLMRNEAKQAKVNNINLGNMGFISRFRIRQMIKEARTALTVVFGMFVSMLILMMAIDCYVMCVHIKEESENDTKYEYMYTYKYPAEEIPKGSEAAFGKSFKKEAYGYNLDVTLLGIDESNPYFDAEVTESKKEVVISSAMSQKFQLKSGDIFTITDEEADVNYAFTVKDITQFSTGMYIFMDIDSMRELLDESDDYYNIVFSDEKLDIPGERLYSTTSKEEINHASGIFVEMMMPMVVMLSVVSILIFVVVMYLMMKVMIDRSAFNISLIRIFGYRMKEVKKLYLDGNFYMVAIGALICIPLSKWAMDTIYPVMISNIATGMNLSFGWYLYAGLYMAVIVLYIGINTLLVQRLKKIVPAEVLKNRE